MKKIKVLLVLFIFSLSFVGCESDGEHLGSKSSVISAGKHQFGLEVIVNTTGSIDIDVYTNTKVSTDRSFNIIVSDESTGSPSDYTVPSSVTIPANTNKGTLTVGSSDKTNTLILEIEEKLGVLAAEKIVINIIKVCPYNLDNFVGTYAAVEDGLYNYDVIVTKGVQPNQLVLANLYEGGGTTIINVDATNPALPKVSFPTFGNGGVLYVSGTYGNVYAVNPSTWAAHAGLDTSVLNVCETAMSLAFVRQVAAGIFSNIVKVEMTKK